ncbi:MAG TPA: hypothetical protein ENL12_04210 [Dehalococcoidia bacterium]|nr:hypothetical protein [Dehalococcoidia bacterium]
MRICAYSLTASYDVRLPFVNPQSPRRVGGLKATAISPAMATGLPGMWAVYGSVLVGAFSDSVSVQLGLALDAGSSTRGRERVMWPVRCDYPGAGESVVGSAAIEGDGLIDVKTTR